MRNFEAGAWYRNDHDLYEVREVVEIDGAVKILVRLEDCSEEVLDARDEARVSCPAAPPWWRRSPALRRRAARVLGERGAKHLYHFTALENLRDVQEVGAICSKETLERLGRWPVKVPGGDDLSRDLDEVRDNWRFASLSFAPYTPQYFRKRTRHPLALFCLSLDVAGAGGAIITDTNATANDRRRCGDVVEALPHLDFDSFSRRLHPSDQDTERWAKWKRAVQAEVLVPNRVPLCFNEKIIVETREHAHFVDEVFGPISEVVPLNDAPRPQLFWDPDEPPPWEPVGD